MSKAESRRLAELEARVAELEITNTMHNSLLRLLVASLSFENKERAENWSNVLKDIIDGTPFTSGRNIYDRRQSDMSADELCEVLVPILDRLPFEVSIPERARMRGARAATRRGGSTVRR